MSNILLEILAKKPYLIADGAMGTSLFNLGLQSGDAPEFWNVNFPERVEAVHQEYVDAGSDIILTNSFGANEYRLKLHKSADRVYELSKAAAVCAKKIADKTERQIIIGGSIGPTGELFEPLGPLTIAEATKAFALTAQGLVDGGADILWVETMSSREESKAAVAGAATTGKPIVVTMTFDTNGKTMMGISPEEAYKDLNNLAIKPTAIGANCGLGPTESIISISAITDVMDDGAIIVAKANCGIPEFSNGEFKFTGTPELMGKYARMARDCGARIIGGCCGSDGVIVKAIKDSLEGYISNTGNKPTKEQIIASLGPLTNAPSPHSHNGDNNAANDGNNEPRRKRRRRRE